MKMMKALTVLALTAALAFTPINPSTVSADWGTKIAIEYHD